MAAPHVTGMIALILQSFPDLTQTEVEFIVKNAAHGNPLPADGTSNGSSIGDGTNFFSPGV